MPPIFTATYSLNENDFLTHQLYLASKSERINKKRKRSRYIALGIYLAGASYFLFQGRIIGAAIFALLAVIWYFVADVWDRKRYYNHYKSYIKETYKERMNVPVTVSITDDYLLATDSGSESKIAIKELTAIIELPAIMLIRLNAGTSIPVPKHIPDQSQSIANGLAAVAKRLDIPYINETAWEWR